AAGNYLLCDVDTSSTWTGLADGVYTASTTTYTKAGNRVDNLISDEFTVDNVAPIASSLNSPSIVSSTLSATATASDNSGYVESVNFFVTEVRNDGVCTGNGVKLAEQRVFTANAGE